MNAFGIHTLDELTCSGLHPSTISRRYIRVLPKIYSLTEPSALSTCCAITRWRDDAVLSHRSAAYLHGWTPEPAVFDATVPLTSRLNPPSWLRLHRREMSAASVDESWSLPCTTKAQTLLDCAAILPPAEVDVMVDEQLRAGLDPGELLELMAEYPGRRGNPAMERQVRLAVSRFASEPERVLGRAFHAIGLRMEMNAQIGLYICDFADRPGRTAIEVDGREYHSAPEVFSKDRRRQNDIILGSWLLLRYSAFDVLAQPDKIAREVALIVRRRRHARS